MQTNILAPLPDIRSTRPKKGAVVITGVAGYHQMDGFSCGASLVGTIVSAYIGRLDFLAWSKIVEKTDPCRTDGTPTRRVLASLRDWGFTPSRISSFGPDSVGAALAEGNLVLSCLQMPRQSEGETHWVALVGASEDRVLVLNCTGIPLFTKRWMSWDDARALRDPDEPTYSVDTGLLEWVADRRPHLQCNNSR